VTFAWTIASVAVAGALASTCDGPSDAPVTPELFEDLILSHRSSDTVQISGESGQPSLHAADLRRA